MKIYVHSADRDGFCCGGILKQVFPDVDIRLYNYFYDWDRSFGDVEPNEEIIFADVIPRKENLLNLLVITENITLIDHHPSALRDLEKIGRSFPGLIDTTGLGACSLVWKYYFPDIPMPKAVEWISEYDVWKRTPENMAFNFGLQTLTVLPNHRIWKKLLSNDEGLLQYVMRQGKAILNYLTPWYSRLVRSYSIEGMIEGRSTIFLNVGGVDSSVFDSVSNQYDICLRGVIGKDQEWHLSMTTTREDLDLSLIAESFGGGGHAKSSGLKVSKLEDIFKMNQL